MTQAEAIDELVRVFLDATDDLPDDAATGIATVIQWHRDTVLDALGATQRRSVKVNGVDYEQVRFPS